MSDNYQDELPDQSKTIFDLYFDSDKITIIDFGEKVKSALPYSKTIFDLYSDKITIHDFVEKAKSALKFDKDHYLLTLKMGSIFYYCLYRHGSPFIFVTSYLYSDIMSKNDFFLMTDVSDPTSGHIQTESNGIPIDIVCLPGRNKLETIIHILVYFCKMVGIKEIAFTDIAYKQTKNDGYTLISYRIFATDKDISDLSIYSKFFRKKYMLDPSLVHKCIKYKDFLERIRTTKFNELIISFKNHSEDELKVSTEHNDTILIDIDETRYKQKLLEYLKYLRGKIGSNSLLDYFKNFDKEDEEKIKDLKKIKTLLESNQTYKNLIHCVNTFNVFVDDYMYPALVLPQFRSIKKIRQPKRQNKSLKKTKRQNKSLKKTKAKSKHSTNLFRKKR
jgi:hypothetical protein